jgi:hypothetical protein
MPQAALGNLKSSTMYVCPASFGQSICEGSIPCGLPQFLAANSVEIRNYHRIFFMI